jgi:hypothetical protein
MDLRDASSLWLREGVGPPQRATGPNQLLAPNIPESLFYYSFQTPLTVRTCLGMTALPALALYHLFIQLSLTEHLLYARSRAGDRR